MRSMSRSVEEEKVEEEEEEKAWYDVSVEISWNQIQSFHVLSGSNARTRFTAADLSRALGD